MRPVTYPIHSKREFARFAAPPTLRTYTVILKTVFAVFADWYVLMRSSTHVSSVAWCVAVINARKTVTVIITANAQYAERFVKTISTGAGIPVRNAI